MKALTEIILHRELLFNLVTRNLKSRYKNSILGFLWTILTPLFMAIIYVVFLRILARRIPMEEIIIGVFAWQFTSQSVGNGLAAITGNSNLVKKVAFPRIILPLSTTLSNLVNFLLTLIVQFILVAILLALHSQHMNIAVIAVPIIILYHTLLCLALAMFLSCMNVYFRDLEHLVNVLLLAWFFLSPVMYSLSLVKEIASPAIVSIYMLNPMAVIITGYRALTLPGSSFPMSPIVGISLVLPIIFLLIAYILFEKTKRNFSDLL